MENYFYSSVAAIALVIHLIINWRQLADWRTVMARSGAVEFRHFILCLTVFFVTDILWGFLAEWGMPRLLYANTLLFFLMMALSVQVWTRFVATYLEMEGRLRRGLLRMGSCFHFIQFQDSFGG